MSERLLVGAAGASAGSPGAHMVREDVTVVGVGTVDPGTGTWGEVPTYCLRWPQVWC